MPVKAIIFDMDDLMIDSHPVHIQTIEDVLKERDPSVSFRQGQNTLAPAEEAGFFGKKIPEVIGLLCLKYKIIAPLKELNERYNAKMLVNLPRLVKPMPGLYDLITMLAENDYKLALASSAPRAKINVVLKLLRLEETFNPEWIVSGEDEIKHGKPSPDIFLRAAQKLGLSPNECLVLEDAEVGVQAAKAAGMYCIGVHNRFAYERLGVRQNLSQATLQVNGLSEVSLQYIRKLRDLSAT